MGFPGEEGDGGLGRVTELNSGHCSVTFLLCDQRQVTLLTCTSTASSVKCELWIPTVLVVLVQESIKTSDLLPRKIYLCLFTKIAYYFKEFMKSLVLVRILLDTSEGTHLKLVTIKRQGNVHGSQKFWRSHCFGYSWIRSPQDACAPLGNCWLSCWLFFQEGSPRELQIDLSAMQADIPLVEQPLKAQLRPDTIPVDSGIDARLAMCMSL